MDATIVYIAALVHFQDLKKLQDYMELAQDKLEQERILCVQFDLNLLTFEEFEKIDRANRLSEEIETKV